MLVLTTFWSFLARSLKNFSLKFRRKFWEEKSENYFFRNFYSGHVNRISRTMTKVSAENPKRFKTLKKVPATNCSSGHAKGSFDNFLKFFGQKSEIFFAQHPKKSLKRKIKKNYFSRNFYSEHVDRVLRTMPRVYAENPKRFKTFKSFLQPEIVPLHTQMLVLTTSRSFLARSRKNFSLKFRKNSEKKKQKNYFIPQFLLWTRR